MFPAPQPLYDSVIMVSTLCMLSSLDKRISHHFLIEHVQTKNACQIVNHSFNSFKSYKVCYYHDYTFPKFAANS